MKVAYVLGGLPFGGIENWLLSLGQEVLKRQLYEFRVFNISGTGNLMPQFLEAGLDVRCISDSKRSLVSYRFDTTIKLRRELQAYQPDIIHTIHYTANYHGRLAALGLGIPVVMHLRNTKREKKLFRRFSDKALSYATTEYLAVSEAVAQTIAEDHNKAERPVTVLYNALDPARMDMPALDLQKAYGFDCPVVLAVGRYVPQKNLDLLVRAVRILRDADFPVALVLVGEGSERSRLEALRDELGLQQYVVLTGFRDDVAAYCKGADVFAMPSDFEGFLIAQLEAMYCGLPCVVSRHVPLLEVAADASLVCELNAEDIAQKLRLLLQDSELYARLQEAARRIASSMTMENYAQHIDKYYKKIILQKK